MLKNHKINQSIYSLVNLFKSTTYLQYILLLLSWRSIIFYCRHTRYSIPHSWFLSDCTAKRVLHSKCTVAMCFACVALNDYCVWLFRGSDAFFASHFFKFQIGVASAAHVPSFPNREHLLFPILEFSAQYRKDTTKHVLFIIIMVQVLFDLFLKREK